MNSILWITFFWYFKYFKKFHYTFFWVVLVKNILFTLGNKWQNEFFAGFGLNFHWEEGGKERHGAEHAAAAGRL